MRALIASLFTLSARLLRTGPGTFCVLAALARTTARLSNDAVGVTR